MELKPPQYSIERREKINARILHADDDESLKRVLNSLLNRRYSSVESVHDGSILLERLNAPNLTYDLVVSDNNMPEMDGIEALRRLRASGNKVPFILLTGLPSQSLQDEVKKLGGIFLTKPVNFGVLYNSIDNIVEPPKV